MHLASVLKVTLKKENTAPLTKVHGISDVPRHCSPPDLPVAPSRGRGRGRRRRPRCPHPSARGLRALAPGVLTSTTDARGGTSTPPPESHSHAQARLLTGPCLPFLQPGPPKFQLDTAQSLTLDARRLEVS